VRTLMLADGPARYLGGSIESFALPMAAFILIATGLYFIFRSPHHVPKMRYLEPATQTSVGTREPGTVGLTVVHTPVPASSPIAEATTTVPGGQPPMAADSVLHPDVAASQAAADAPAADAPAADAPAADAPAAADSPATAESQAASDTPAAASDTPAAASDTPGAAGQAAAGASAAPGAAHDPEGDA
jgi:cytoskeletal protein RodZ